MATAMADHGGFTFAGHEAAEFNLEYVPDTTQMYVWQVAPYEQHEESFPAHDGGYYYGETLKPKDFTLKCIFQQEDVRDGVLSNIEAFFRRGRIGKLVFDKRPWLYYMARVIRIEIQMTNFLNGFVTIYMRAHYPFARYDNKYVNTGDEYYENIIANSNLLSLQSLPNTMPIPISTSTTFTEDGHILLYNGGTEYAPVAVTIMGDVGEGFDIINETTGEKMGFVAINNTVGQVICDSLNGKTISIHNGNSQLAFLYHDEGFLHLKPGYPVLRNKTAVIRGTLLYFNEYIDENRVGQYVGVDSQWRKIVDITGSSATSIVTVEYAFNNISSGSSKQANIATMNEITLSPRSEATITMLNFEYKPTFA